jgi:hypothetical protein
MANIPPIDQIFGVNDGNTRLPMIGGTYRIIIATDTNYPWIAPVAGHNGIGILKRRFSYCCAVILLAGIGRVYKK